MRLPSVICEGPAYSDLKLEISFGNFIMKFHLETSFGNFIWKFQLEIAMGTKFKSSKKARTFDLTFYLDLTCTSCKRQIQEEYHKH